MPEKDHWGYELILDLFNCNRNCITQKEPIREYIRQVLNLINMKPYGKCRVERFGEGDINGISAFQFLMTSSITIHCREDNGHNDCYINLFSCKEFSPEKVIIFSQVFFNAKAVNFDFKLR
jgi:S-adenosylmethionine/arginine decarboxylase-like enzyme